MKILGRFLLYSLSLAVAAYAVFAYALVPVGDLLRRYSADLPGAGDRFGYPLRDLLYVYRLA